MPLGSAIVAEAKAILTLERQGFAHGLSEEQARFHRFAQTQERDLSSMSSHQLKARRLQNEYTASVARFGPESQRTIRALERLKLAEEQASRQSRISAGRTGLFGRQARESEKHVNRLGRGVLAGSGAFRHLGRSVAFASSYFLGGVGLTYAIKSAVSAASDLEEQVSKTNVVFGANGRDVVRWARTLANSFGISQRAALTYAGSFGALLRPLGIRQAPAANISKTLTERAADIASFYNTSVEDALKAIQSGLVGQTRPLRRFGVQLSEDRIKAFAFTSGIARPDVDARKVAEAQDRVAIATAKVGEARRKYGPQSVEAAQAELTLKKAEDQLHAALSGSHTQLTAAQKTMARYRIILHDTSLAHGDFARTSGHLAQQQKILHAQIDNLTESIGRVLIPIVTRYVRQLTHWLSSSKNQAQVTRTVKSAVSGLATVINVTAGAIRRIVGAFRLLNRVTGSGRHTVELLGAAFIGLKIFRWVSGFQQMRRAIFGVRAASLATIPALEGLAVAEAEAGAAGGGVGRVGRAGRFARVLGPAAVLATPLAAGTAVAVVSSAGASRQYEVPAAVHDALADATPAQLRHLDRFLHARHPHFRGTLAEAYSKFADFRAEVLRTLGLATVDTSLSATHGLGPHHTARRPPRRRTQQARTADAEATPPAPARARRFHELQRDRAKSHAARVQHHKKVEAEQARHRKALAAEARKKRQEARQAALAERQAFLAGQMGFFSEFAPDIFTPGKRGLTMGSTPTGGKTVIVNQHFNAPPQSNFQTFRQAEFAARHVL